MSGPTVFSSFALNSETRMPPTGRWPEMPSIPAAMAALANVDSRASVGNRNTTFIRDLVGEWPWRRRVGNVPVGRVDLSAVKAVRRVEVRVQPLGLGTIAPLNGSHPGGIGRMVAGTDLRHSLRRCSTFD